MATSRTATATHQRMRKMTLARAQAQGITHCPGCGEELDYDNGTTKNGAQADEIVPFAITGVTSTDPDDWQVLCRTCNRRKSDKVLDGGVPENPYPWSRNWSKLY